MDNKLEYNLEGAFKMETYDSQNNLVESTDWFNNFITQSGLYYPNIYSFANCFRFLSLGSDSSLNYGGLGAAVPFIDSSGNPINKNPTTGVYNPLFEYRDSNNNTQKGTFLGWEAYETGTDPLKNSACRTVSTPSGLRFYRAWQVPSGGVGTTVNEPGGFLNIQELSVSPGDRGDVTGAFAFSRVVRNLPLKNGYRAIISYQLQVNCSNYNLSLFTGEVVQASNNNKLINVGTFDTGSADVSTDYDLMQQWARLSGTYRQVWAGLDCIDSYGVTFTPKYGSMLEPSKTDLSRHYLYLSPDNSQFDVNNTSGGPISTSSSAWSSDGVMKQLSQTLSLTAKRATLGEGKQNIDALFYGETQINHAVPTAVTPFNIRLGDLDAPLKAPYLVNYTKTTDYVDNLFNYQGVTESGPNVMDARLNPISYATPGGSGMNFTRATDTKEKAVFSSRLYNTPTDMVPTSPGSLVGNHITGRKKNKIRKAIFPPASSVGYNSRFGSMVMAYLADSTTLGKYIYYPVMDTLFYDTSGRSLMSHYRLISGIHLTERGSGIVNCTISINPQSTNITRHVSLKTFQGPVSGYLASHPYKTNFPSNFFSGGTGCGPHTNGPVVATGTSGDLYWRDNVKGYSGWGGVYGVIDQTYDIDASKVYDIGVVAHSTGESEPTGQNSSSLYWPFVGAGTFTTDAFNRLHVDFSNIVFSGSTHLTHSVDVPSSGASQLAALGWCRPTGYIVHYDNINLSGYRLLPNFGAGNIDFGDNGSLYYNTASNTTDIGGALPALSLDNGLEVYLDIGWNSNCNGCVVGSCLDPVTMAPNT